MRNPDQHMAEATARLPINEPAVIRYTAATYLRQMGWRQSPGDHSLWWRVGLQGHYTYAEAMRWEAERLR